MRSAWKLGLTAVAIAGAIACGANDRAPDRDATQNAAGTSGRESGEITVTGCVALGQMGTYMLTSEENLPQAEGLGRSAATKGYQLLGQPDDFNQYMNKRVRVTGVPTAHDQEPADSTSPRAANNAPGGTTPWPRLQVREIDPIGGECSTRK